MLFREDDQRKDALIGSSPANKGDSRSLAPSKAIVLSSHDNMETDHTGRGADHGSCLYHGGRNTAATHDSGINESPAAMNYYRLCLCMLNKRVITNAQRPRLTVSVDPLSFPFLILYFAFGSKDAGISMFLGCKRTSDPPSLN